MRPIVFLLAAALLAGGCDRQKQAAPQAPAAEAAAVKGLDRSHKGEAAPDTVFKDPDGGDISLEEFRGLPVLVNLWASWCAPCIRELPTLDRLARSHRVDGQLAVLAVSQDMAPQNSVRAFLKARSITDLGAFHDSAMGLSSALGAQILPTTIYYDGDGRELWRYVGDLDWTSAEAGRLLAEAGA